MSAISFDSAGKIRNQLNILCIQQIGAGKTSFLADYTNQVPDDGDYKIFLKKVKDFIIFLHDVESDQEVYLSQKFDGILFFIDLIHSINAQNLILKWIDLYSKFTGRNIFKIPIHVIVLKVELPTPSQFHQYRISIQNQLSRIISKNQITYWKNNDYKSIDYLNQYYQILYSDINPKHHCIKDGTYVRWKINGTVNFIKSLYNQFKPIFLWTRIINYFYPLQQDDILQS